MTSQTSQSSRQSTATASHSHDNLLPDGLLPHEDLTSKVRATQALSSPAFGPTGSSEKVFGSICRILHRRRCRHVVITGDRGVGKSAVVAELARRAGCGEIPFLSTKRFIWVDARYVPVHESRMRLGAFLSHVVQHDDLVLCIEGFRSLLAAERGSDNKSMLLSALSASAIQIVGLMSDRDYEDMFAEDHLMLEWFDRVQLLEPDLRTTQNLLNHYKRGLEKEFELTLSDDAVRRAVSLSANYILNERLPGKALKTLHRACENVRYEKLQLGKSRDEVNVDDVVDVVSTLSGVPSETLRGIAEECDYEKSLREFIVGQDDALRVVATELSLIKAGLTDASKPASVMLFVGMTGTGKTELAKTLARFYSASKRLRMYTMANFVEPHSVSGIIGVPAGYVGHEVGGRLINELNADPYGVFLLDEADKTHPDVLQPFLNLFDEGWIRDQRGVLAHANNSIFILTTNVGQRMIADMVKKERPMSEINEKVKDALSSIRHTKANRPVFAPEFLARIKRIVVFRPLDEAAMKGICQTTIRKMSTTWLNQRDKSLEISDDVAEFLAKRSHSLNHKSQGKEGGRIVRKLFSDHVESAIQRETAKRTEAYRACSLVRVSGSPTNGSSSSESEDFQIKVDFCD